jgi:hypothetical protein
MTTSGFSFDTSKFKSGKHLDLKIRRAMLGVCKYWDGRAETYMKNRAPWRDRTTNARNGLTATAVKFTRNLVGIVLAHSVEYGVYLETKDKKNGGRPIIMPTVDVYGPKVVKTLTNIMDRLDKAVGGA